MTKRNRSGQHVRHEPDDRTVRDVLEAARASARQRIYHGAGPNREPTPEDLAAESILEMLADLPIKDAAIVSRIVVAVLEEHLA